MSLKLSEACEAQLKSMLNFAGTLPLGTHGDRVRALIADALDEERREIYDAIALRQGITARALHIVNARIGRERSGEGE